MMLVFKRMNVLPWAMWICCNP